MTRRKMPRASRPSRPLSEIDFSQKAYRGYLIRKHPFSGEMWIEKDGHLIGRVPPSQSWAWAEKEIDALLGPHKNPRKRAAKKKANYVNRPSQITKGPPSKRLRKRRRKNVKAAKPGYFPNPSSRPVLFFLTAQKGRGPKMHFDGANFSQRPRVKSFPTAEAAETKARALLKSFPILRAYAVRVETQNRPR